MYSFAARGDCTVWDEPFYTAYLAKSGLQHPMRQQVLECDKRDAQAIGIGYSDKMLRWDAGAKPFDGVWAAYWYDAVHTSTGFAAAEGAIPRLPKQYDAVLAQALPIYEQLATYALELD